MKRKEFKKKLKLKKQLISNLSVDQINSVKGGIRYQPNTKLTCQNTCNSCHCDPVEPVRS